MRTALTAAVYRKSLRLAPAARQAATTGEVVNLMQLDSQRLEVRRPVPRLAVPTRSRIASHAAHRCSPSSST